jgi:carboxylesterase
MPQLPPWAWHDTTQKVANHFDGQPDAVARDRSRMMPLLILGVALTAIASIRALIIRRVEQRDAVRPRSTTGVFFAAEGFVLDRPAAPAVLLLHGAGDTPQTLRGLADYLFQRGYAVAAPLLPGHGRSVRDFRQVTGTSWQTAAFSAYDRLEVGRPWIGIVGLSMGGALGAVIASERPASGALVLLAPYLRAPWWLRMGAASSYFANLFSPYFPSGDPRSIRDPEAAARGLAYGVFTPAAARALCDTADAGMRALAAVRTPTLIIQSRQDNRVASRVTEEAYARLGTSDRCLEWVLDGGHVITVDYGKERVFALTADWLAAHGAAALLSP